MKLQTYLSLTWLPSLKVMHWIKQVMENSKVLPKVTENTKVLPKVTENTKVLPKVMENTKVFTVAH